MYAIILIYHILLMINCEMACALSHPLNIVYIINKSIINYQFPLPIMQNRGWFNFRYLHKIHLLCP